MLWTNDHTTSLADKVDRDSATWIAVGALVALGTAIRLQQLTHSLFEAYAFRQTQTAFAVREYAMRGIDLRRTPLPVFGPDSNVPFEFPLFQAVAALVTRLGLDSAVASRTVGLLSFQASAVLLAVLVRRWHGRTTALIAVALFEFLPFGLQWGAASMIDFFSVALALAMVVALDTWFTTGRVVSLAVGSVAAILAFLVKASTAPCWGVLLLGSSLIVLRDQGWIATWRRQLVGYAVGPGLGLAAALWWTRYTDNIKEENELTHFLMSDQLTDWYFGTGVQRRQLVFYGRIMNRVTEEILGVGLVVVVIASIILVWSRPEADRVRLGAWILTAVSGPLVFFNLYFVHDYYLIAVYPAIVVVAAVGATWLAQRLSSSAFRQYGIAGVVTVAMVVSTMRTELGQQSVSNFRTSAVTPAASVTIRATTQEDDLIVVIGCDWNPVFLFFAERSGVMFRSGAPVAEYWESADVGDYDYLFRCGDELDPGDYLPEGYSALPIESQARLWTVEADRNPVDG